MKLLGYFCNKSLFNKIFFITFVALISLLSVPAFAQERGGDDTNKRFDRESFLVKRSAFITAELSLTPNEAAEFIPLMEELQQRKFEAGHVCRKLNREIRLNSNPTDADYVTVIDECLNVTIKEAELDKEYYEKFKKILSPDKLYRYKPAELKFARDFMRDGERRKERKQK